MSTSKENIPQEKKYYEFLTKCFNPRTSLKDEYYIQMKLEGNKIYFTAQKVGDISEFRYTSSSTYEELKQSQVLNLFKSINEIYESLLSSIKSAQSSGQEQLIHIDLLKGSLNLKISINFKDLYFELKEQEKNLLDAVNDLRKRVKSLEIQNQPGMMGSGMMGPGMMQHGMMGSGMMKHGMMESGVMQHGMMESGVMQHGMMGSGMMQHGMMGSGMMQHEMMSTSHETEHSSTSKNFIIEFFVKDSIIRVQGDSNLTINKLIKNFEVKLCNEDIRIKKYLIHPTGVELDPSSIETLASKGITDGTRINVVTTN